MTNDSRTSGAPAGTAKAGAAGADAAVTAGSPTAGTDLSVADAAPEATIAAPPTSGRTFARAGIGTALVLAVLAGALPWFQPWLKTPLHPRPLQRAGGTRRDHPDPGRAGLVRQRDVQLRRRLRGRVRRSLVASRRRAADRRSGRWWPRPQAPSLGLFMVRYREIFFGMLNLAFSMVLFSVLGKFGAVHRRHRWAALRPAAHGRRRVRSRQLRDLAALPGDRAGARVARFVVHRYFGSVSGQALAAIKSNETRLEYLGISAKRVFWHGYVWSAALCGLGGTLFALAQGLVTPEMGYWVRSGEIVFVAILGGAAYPVGAFVGAFVFEFVKLYAAALLTGTWQLVLGVVLIAIIFLAPDGLYGLIARFRRKRRGTTETARRE